MPFLQVDLLGVRRGTRLWSAVLLFIDSGWLLIGVGVAAFTVILPLVRSGLLTACLGAVRLGARPAWVGPAFRCCVALNPWSMLDILLIGAFVGYTRVSANIPTEIESGAWCFMAAAFLSTLLPGILDERAVWRAIGSDLPVPPAEPIVSCVACDLVLPQSAEDEPCPRCRALVTARKPDAMVRTAALVATGLVLYPASNVWPMTTVVKLGQVERHTIFYGIYKLLDADLWPFALIIFITSVSIPLLKLLGIGWFLLSVKLRWRWALLTRTRLHRVIEMAGRWSALDIMIISVFAPLMQFGQLATVHAGTGALCFFAVVIVTMLASSSFDPRLMWDAVEEAG